MRIEAKVDFWKKKLLDLGKRNKLINFPANKINKRVSRSSIIIESPSADELWNLFSNADGNISFPVVKKTEENNGDSEMQIDPDSEANGDSDIFPNGYKTDQIPHEACKTFRALMHKSKEFMDNKGLNALYLAFGFLNWKENGSEGQVLRSPILLIPVCISQDNVSSPFIISRIDSEIISNNTLLYKLKNDFNIDIPEYSEENDWKQYLRIIDEECSSLGWKIEYDRITLSMITYQKMAMYSDMEQNADIISNNSIVNILNGDSELIKIGDYSDIKDYNHDNTDPKQIYSVVDADSSQQDAILLAKRGASFVLQGPPGTGKSQTITNIIAELLAQGKSVLFVSEKLAALQVVYNRLSAAGIGDFCLTLHNPNAKRREIMDQLQSSIDLSSKKVKLNQMAVDQLNQLVTERQKLNSYVTQLHTIVPPLNETVFRINGYITSLEGYPDIDFVYENAINTSAEEFNTIISLLSDFMLIIKKYGYQKYNPWQGSTLTSVNNRFWQKFSAETNEFKKHVDIGRNIFESLCHLIGKTNLSDTLSDLEKWQVLLEHSLNSPHIAYSMASNGTVYLCDLVKYCQIARQKKERASEVERQLVSENELLSVISEKMIAAQALVTCEYRDEILTIDAYSLLERYKNKYGSIFRIFKSSYRSDRKQLMSFSKLNKKPSYTQALELLNKIISAQQLKNEYDNQLKAIGSIQKHLENLSNEISSLSQLIDKTIAQYQNAVKNCSERHDDLCKQINDITTTARNTTDEIIQLCTKLYQIISEWLNESIDDNTDLDGLYKNAVWLKDFVEMCDRFEVGNDFRNEVCAQAGDYHVKLFDIFSRFQDWKVSYTSICENLLDSFDDTKKSELTNLSMQELFDRMDVCSKSYSMLEYYIDYKNIISEMDSKGTLQFIRKTEELKLPSGSIIPCFKKCFYRSWLDGAILRFDAIASFRSEKQEAVVSEFKALDKEQMEIAKAYLKEKLISRLPNLDSFVVGGTEVTILRRELKKQRKLMPLRKLISNLPSLLPALKPCIMMSPLSVSTYFRNTGYKFDTVIFDEASQVRTEDAICSIFRGNQVIIAGDSKQLPPTDFFSTSFTDSDEFLDDEDGIDDAGAYESLLDEASSLPTQTLLWHYRSKNEQLIAFSNHKIYNGNLITFPSSVEEGNDIGVEYIYTPNGVYDRGGRNGNRVEADKVAELVFDHIKRNGNRSLGIIAFNEKQQTIIEDAIIRKRQENPQYEFFFKDSENEPFFIRNLETVQGDERDTIIFSIGFGYDKDGKFLMNFGPLSKNGGERRLNVAVTRARYNLKLVGSIMPTDINVDKINSLGPKLLRLYIDYAINGPKAILSETTADNSISFDSPFEESVYTFLVSKGYNVATQVGCSGYRIDMAVRHPHYNGRFAIGIECDGAAYHSARTARERDRLRQSILESMGWKIYRIWSTDWIKDSDAEKKKLLDAIEKAITLYHEDYCITEKKTENTIEEQYLDVSVVDTKDHISDDSRIKSIYAGMNVQDVPISDIEETIIKVLEMGYGYDMETLIKSTAKYGYDWLRTGKNIKARINTALDSLKRKKAIIIENGVINIKQ